MNKFIKQQLDKCRIPLPEYDDNTTHIVIYRNNNISELENLQIGVIYDIKVADYIINEPPTFTLSANWNGGTKPPEHLLTVEIIQLMGKMVKINAIGKNTNIRWTGFLPRKSIEVIKKYE